MLSDFLGFIIPGVVTMLTIVRGWDLLRELVPHDD